MGTPQRNDFSLLPEADESLRAREARSAITLGLKALQALQDAGRTPVAKMVSSLDHHINNPLQQASDALHLLRGIKSPDRNSRVLIMVLEDAMERLAEILTRAGGAPR